MASHTLSCPACKQTVTTTVAPGQTTRCKQCKSEVRVPLRGVEHARRAFACSACGERQETSTPPGKRTTCRGCQAEVRVPLRDPTEAPPPVEPAASGKRRRRVEAGQPCRYCRARATPEATSCSSCGAELALLVESVPGGRVGGSLLLVVGLGGLAALALGGSTYVRGYLLFALLGAMGAAALGHGRSGRS
jgi:hypothetical protein